MSPESRKGWGMTAIVVFVAIYALVVALFAPAITRLPVLAQTLLYLILGIAWALPLRPLINWMGTGRWRK